MKEEGNVGRILSLFHPSRLLGVSVRRLSTLSSSPRLLRIRDPSGGEVEKGGEEDRRAKNQTIPLPKGRSTGRSEDPPTFSTLLTSFLGTEGGEVERKHQGTEGPAFTGVMSFPTGSPLHTAPPNRT